MVIQLDDLNPFAQKQMGRIAEIGGGEKRGGKKKEKALVKKILQCDNQGHRTRLD